VVSYDISDHAALNSPMTPEASAQSIYQAHQAVLIYPTTHSLNIHGYVPLSSIPGPGLGASLATTDGHHCYIITGAMVAALHVNQFTHAPLGRFTSAERRKSVGLSMDADHDVNDLLRSPSQHTGVHNHPGRIVRLTEA
jgi:hypothetical protein